jgi:5-methylcytosine-specific restriction endonuclease McrA
MPWNRNDYPEHWHEIVAAIRTRANNRCEWCGVLNGAERISTSGKTYNVVLTTAHLGVPHLDGRPGNAHDKHDVRPENLAYLCNSCHLRQDVTEHIETRRRKRREAQMTAGQLPLFDDE